MTSDGTTCDVTSRRMTSPLGNERFTGVFPRCDARLVRHVIWLLPPGTAAQMTILYGDGPINLFTESEPLTLPDNDPKRSIDRILILDRAG